MELKSQRIKSELGEKGGQHSMTARQLIPMSNVGNFTWERNNKKKIFPPLSFLLVQIRIVTLNIKFKPVDELVSSILSNGTMKFKQIK